MGINRQFGWLGAAALALALTGCGRGSHRGGGEDFAITVARSPQDVIAPFLHPDLGDFQRLFPRLHVAVSRPSDHAVLYSIAAAGPISLQDTGQGMPPDQTTILLDFESIGRASTRIHASIDAAPAVWNQNGKDMVLDDDKIEHEMRKVVEAMASGLVKRDDLESPRSELAALLAGVAIASSPALRKQAKALENNPGAAAALLGEGRLFGDRPMGTPADDGRGNRFGEADDSRPAQTARGSAPEPDEDFGTPDLPDPSHTDE